MNRLILAGRDTPIVKDYLKDVSRYPLLTKEEELEIAKKAELGDKKAKDKLIVSNLRFVITIAKQYQGKNTDILDLINEGNRGLIHAVDMYKTSKNVRFVSYAVWWIRQYIGRFINENGKTVRQPTNHILNALKISKIESEFETINNRPPTDDEVAEIAKLPLITVKNTRYLKQHTVSLDTQFDSEDDGSNTLIDVIPNKDVKSLDQNLIDESFYKTIHNVLDDLSDRDHDIICMVFGIDCTKCSLTIIGKKFGITSERVRQVKFKILEKIKNKHIDELKELL